MKSKELVFKNGAELLEFIKGIVVNGSISFDWTESSIYINEDRIKMDILRKFNPDVGKAFDEAMETFESGE